MNKAEYRKNYNELLKKTVEMLQNYREAALKSGALDLDSESVPFRLPKNVMCAALRECQAQWGPVRAKDRNAEEIENIYRMTNLP